MPPEASRTIPGAALRTISAALLASLGVKLSKRMT